MFRGWYDRGYVPHRDDPGLIQFVTFRLADSLPSSMQPEWEHLRDVTDDLERRCEIESWLDRGLGSCALREPDVARIVENALLYFNGDRYDLLAWVVMPNHVHVLFRIVDVSMAAIVGSLKKHTAQKVNRLLRRRGAFWQADYWDTYMRDHDHRVWTLKYIEDNPSGAKLVGNSRDWPWSSARFRDPFGVLKL